MDDAGELAPMQLRRSGTPWREDDVQELVDALRNGYPIDEIAHQLQRTEDAVIAMAARLVPPANEEIPARRRERVAWLREQLARHGSDYDWRSPWAAYHADQLQTRAGEQVLRKAWEQRSPDVDHLADQLGVTVRRLVREFIELGLGHGIEDVVDRLGCSPDGQGRKQLDLILHNRAYTAFVLLVVDGEGRLVHVSVHHEQLLAEAARDRVLPALARELALQGREVTDLKPRIVPRLFDAPTR
jgi:hypothetical protein